MKVSLCTLLSVSTLVLVPGLLLCQETNSPRSTSKTATTATPSPTATSSFPFSVRIKNIFVSPSPQPTRPATTSLINAQPVTVSYRSINRKAGSEIELWLNAEGKAFKRAIAWRSRTQRVVDSTNKNVNYRDYSAWNWNRIPPNDSDSTAFIITMTQPSPKVRYLRECTGNIELVTPTNDPTSRIVINGFRALAGKPLPYPALKKHRLKVTVLTREQYERRKKQRDSNSKALVRDFAGVFGGTLHAGNKHNVAVRVNNAHEILGRVAFTDSKGREVPHDGCGLLNSFVDCAFKSRLPDSTRITLDFATFKSVVKVPFHLKQIPLADLRP